MVDVAEGEIQRMADKLGLEQAVVTVAQAIYRRSLKHDFIQNRTIAQVATASLYAACRVEDKGYSSRDVWEVSQTAYRSINRTFADISKDLELKTGPIDPKNFLPRYRSELGVGEELEAKAIELIDETAEVGVDAGFSPSGTAAAAIYVAALLLDLRLTQREIAAVAKVSESTIRNRYMVLIEYIAGEYSGDELEEGDQ